MASHWKENAPEEKKCVAGIFVDGWLSSRYGAGFLLNSRLAVTGHQQDNRTGCVAHLAQSGETPADYEHRCNGEDNERMNGRNWHRL
jgi:hypothetical protein